MQVGGRTPTSSLPRTLLWLLGLGGLLLIGLLTSIDELVLPSIVRTAAVAEIPTAMQIDMEFADYNVLLEQRELALAKGVVISGPEDWLSAVVRSGDEVVSVRLRLIEGTAADLGPDDQWPLELRVEDDLMFLGLQRFYLQPSDPAGVEARAALNRALGHAGILAARTRWVRIVFNGDDRGLYALQEGFTDALLEAQGRPQGVIVGFDADSFWQQVAHFDGDLTAALADPVLDLEGLHYLDADAFGDAAIDRDPALAAQRDAAIALLHALQARARPAGEILDVDRYSRFLALIDLWGFPGLASPLNLGFHFEPGVGRLEPVAFYGSSVPSSAERLSLTATYHDPQLQMAYARVAVQVSDPEYLDELRVTLGETYSEALWERLAGRQELIRRSLRPIRPVFAYLAEPTAESYGVLRVGVANVTQLPVEILGFDVGGLTFLEFDPTWQRDGHDERVAGMEGMVLRAHATGTAVRYVHFDIPLALLTAQDAELDPHGDFDLFVAARVIGGAEYSLTPARPGLPSLLQEGK